MQQLRDVYALEWSGAKVVDATGHTGSRSYARSHACVSDRPLVLTVTMNRKMGMESMYGIGGGLVSPESEAR